MPASYTSGQYFPILVGIQPAEFHRKESTLSPCHIVWTSLLHSALACSPGECISNRDTHLYLSHNNSSVHLTITTKVRRSGVITDGMRSDWRALRDSVLSSPTPAPSLLEWPYQEQCWSGLTASAPVSDVSAPAYTVM